MTQKFAQNKEKEKNMTSENLFHIFSITDFFKFYIKQCFLQSHLLCKKTIFTKFKNSNCEEEKNLNSNSTQEIKLFEN